MKDVDLNKLVFGAIFAALLLGFFAEIPKDNAGLVSNIVSALIGAFTGAAVTKSS